MSASKKESWLMIFCMVDTYVMEVLVLLWWTEVMLFMVDRRRAADRSVCPQQHLFVTR